MKLFQSNSLILLTLGMCSFEASDICGYTQDHDTDDFNWVRSSGPTSSISTGPVADHTYGTLYGKSCMIVLWCSDREEINRRVLPRSLAEGCGRLQ